MLRPTCRKEASRLDPSGKELPGVGGGGSKLYSSTATPASGKALARQRRVQHTVAEDYDLQEPRRHFQLLCALSLEHSECELWSSVFRVPCFSCWGSAGRVFSLATQYRVGCFVQTQLIAFSYPSPPRSAVGRQATAYALSFPSQNS
ncbi:uncharacterized protein LOC144292809 isoform X1 [Canis aureus]